MGVRVSEQENRPPSLPPVKPDTTGPPFPRLMMQAGAIKALRVFPLSGNVLRVQVLGRDVRTTAQDPPIHIPPVNACDSAITGTDTTTGENPSKD